MSNHKPIILAIQNDETDAPHLDWWCGWRGSVLKLKKVLRALYAGESVPTSVPEGIFRPDSLGGHMNATEDHLHPWLAAERALLKDAIDRDITIFAILLGTQPCSCRRWTR
jgi:hypothetical protein